MKKGLIVVLGGLVCTQALFAGGEIENAAESARIIRYTVTIHREDTYDADRWDNLTQDAVRAIKRNIEPSGGDGMDALFNGIQGIYRSTQNDELGIHGTITVSFSNGECSEGTCEKACKCKEQYRGVCPCALDNQRSCKDLAQDDGSCCCKSVDYSKGKCDSACRAACAVEEKSV